MRLKFKISFQELGLFLKNLWWQKEQAAVAVFLVCSHIEDQMYSLSQEVE